MSRPAQLEQQIARVNELQAEMLEGNEPKAPGTEPKENVAGTTPTEQVTEPVVVQSPVTVSKEDYDKLEQRYRTLQGMHVADVNRLRSEVSARDAALQDLEDRLVELEKSAKPTAAPAAKYVTKEDEEEYGDTVAMVRRAAREEAEAVAAAREAEYLERIAQLEAQQGHIRNTVVPKIEDLTKQQAEQVKAEFWGAINTQVPDWREVNDNADFKAWLLAEDPITGANRQQFLSQARNNYDASRVIRFFNEWKRTAAGGQTPASTGTTQADLERLVAPGASKGTSAPVQQEKKQWTRADVTKFYNDVNSGKYANRAEEKAKIEADLFLGMSEGRVAKT